MVNIPVGIVFFSNLFYRSSLRRQSRGHQNGQGSPNYQVLIKAFSYFKNKQLVLQHYKSKNELRHTTKNLLCTVVSKPVVYFVLHNFIFLIFVIIQSKPGSLQNKSFVFFLFVEIWSQKGRGK
jgi:hypothetical protein